MNGAALPPELEPVARRALSLAERFESAGHRLFVVGGLIRDALLDRERGAPDLDLTTDARPPVIKGIVAEIADAVWTQGERFGTIGCRVGDEVFEITTHRAERYDEASRKPVVTFGDDILEDLARRDFTINAMAVDVVSRRFIDPHDGWGDLQRGTLRTPLDPSIAFSEDPLRMLRAGRFHAAYDLRPTDELVAAIAALPDRMAIVSAERIRDEIEKLLLVDHPDRGLRLLASTRLLGRVIPPLAGLDAPRATERGRLVGAVDRDAAMRWAALLRDTDMATTVATALRFSGDRTRDVVWFSGAARWVSDAPIPSTPPAVRRAAAAAPSGRDLVEQLDWVESQRPPTPGGRADITAARAELTRLRGSEPDLADPAPLLGGDRVCELLGIEPGPAVGEAMRWLRSLRFDEGPLDPGVAADRLQRWWSTREAG